MSIDDQALRLEKDAIRLLKKLGFEHVNGGTDFKIGGRQIDACGGHEKTLLILECTTQQELGTKIDEFSGKLGEVIRGFKSHAYYRTYSKFKPIMIIDDREIQQTLLEKANKKTPKITIWNRNYLSYYETLQKSVKEFAKYGVLADLDIKPEAREEISVPAFGIETGKKGKLQLFSFIIDARELLRIAYVARRESGGETFYQRMVKTSRLKKIATYLNKGKLFPNSVVVALEKGAWEFEPLKGVDLSPDWITLGQLKIRNSYRACWIIDGQHRLLSYAHTNVPGKLVVSAFAGLSEENQAGYFLDINREAKPVDPNLLWDLLGSINRDSTEGIISNSVKRLRGLKGGFFEDNIRIPSLGIGAFNFNSICVTLEKRELAEEIIATHFKKAKNPLWDKDPERFQKNIANGLNELFIILSESLTSEAKQGVFTDGFVSVVIVLYQLQVVDLMAKPKPEELKSTFHPVAEFLNRLDAEDLANLRKNLSSEGGKTDFRNEMIRLIQENGNPKFGVGLFDQQPSFLDKVSRLEFELNSYVNAVLVKREGPNWFDEIDFDPSQKQTATRHARKHHHEPWEHLNFLTTATSIVTKPELWEKYFKNVFVPHGFSNADEVKAFARMLWDFRSSQSHAFSKPVVLTKEREALLKNIYKIFSRVVSSEPI
ncbi:MAG: DGQHR domain-containing protein [Chloroflexi bacterium]|nr:DGQHR domain-containing protein [Chloroflexota bacterium]